LSQKLARKTVPGEAAIWTATGPGETGTGKAAKAREALTAGKAAKAGNKAYA